MQSCYKNNVQIQDKEYVEASITLTIDRKNIHFWKKKYKDLDRSDITFPVSYQSNVFGTKNRNHSVHGK